MANIAIRIVLAAWPWPRWLKMPKTVIGAGGDTTMTPKIIRSLRERARRKREPSDVLPWDVVEMVTIPLRSDRTGLSPGNNLQIVLGRVDGLGVAHFHLRALDVTERDASRRFDVVNDVLDFRRRMQRMRRNENAPVQDLQGTRAHVP